MQAEESQLPENDQHVIEAIARGNGGVFERVYSANKDQLLTVLVVAFGLDRSAAEDVLHDVFTRMVQQAGSLRLSGSLRSYLAACCRNRARDILRREQRHRDYIDEQQAMPSRPVDPEATLENREAEAEVQRMLDHLPDEQREVVSLHLHGELTFQEAAAVSGISVNTAKSRYRYAIAKLREIWKTAPEGQGESNVR